MHLVGLTGNYGMGKSSVLSVFGSLGAITIRTDVIVDSLLKDKQVAKKVIKILGVRVLSSGNILDKQKIAKLVFNNNELRIKLEKLLHPLVLRKIDNFVGAINNFRSIIIVEVPLLFEGGYQKRFHSTITVFTTKKNALERLKKAGVAAQDANARLKVQMPIRKKKELSDYIIDNNGSRLQTRKQVEHIFSDLLCRMTKK